MALSSAVFLVRFAALGAPPAPSGGGGREGAGGDARQRPQRRQTAQSCQTDSPKKIAAGRLVAFLTRRRSGALSCPAAGRKRGQGATEGARHQGRGPQAATRDEKMGSLAGVECGKGARPRRAPADRRRPGHNYHRGDRRSRQPTRRSAAALRRQGGVAGGCRAPRDGAARLPPRRCAACSRKRARGWTPPRPAALIVSVPPSGCRGWPREWPPRLPGVRDSFAANAPRRAAPPGGWCGGGDEAAKPQVV